MSVYLAFMVLYMHKTGVDVDNTSRTTFGLYVEIILRVIFISFRKIGFDSALRKHAYSNILKISKPKKLKVSDKKKI